MIQPWAFHKLEDNYHVFLKYFLTSQSGEGCPEIPISHFSSITIHCAPVFISRGNRRRDSLKRPMRGDTLLPAHADKDVLCTQTPSYLSFFGCRTMPVMVARKLLLQGPFSPVLPNESHSTWKPTWEFPEQSSKLWNIFQFIFVVTSIWLKGKFWTTLPWGGAFAVNLKKWQKTEADC